jgi:DNA-binding GntR family transcriptional regulator
MAHVDQQGKPAVRDVLRGSALRRRGTADLIAAEVRARILAGDLVPGDPLREADLAEAFGVARNTVREALRLLTQGGLAAHEVHRGVTVRSHTPAEVAATFGLRTILETAAARRAGTLDGEERARLRQALEASEQAAAEGDMKGVLTGNLEFHRELVRLRGNTRLDEIFNGLLAEIRLILTSLQPDVAGPWLVRNRELADLMERGDAETFAAQLERYLDDAQEDVVRRMQGAPGGAGEPARAA